MTPKLLSSLASLAIILSLGACAVAPTHPSLKVAALPDLIPVRSFVADTSSTGGFSVSPDGKRLAWLGSDGVSPALWIKTIGLNDAKAFRTRVRYYRWSADNQFIAVVKDQGGDEDAHIYAARLDGKGAALVDMTPFDKTSSHILQVLDGGDELVISSNRRAKKVFDVFKLNLSSGKLELLATNPGNVGYWGVDRKGQLRARVAVQGDQTLLQIPEIGTDNWKTTATWGRFDTLHPVDMTDDGKAAWVLSNRGRDKLALVKLDFATGTETLVYEAPEVDIDRIRISKKTQQPLMANTMPGYPHQQVFDAALRARFAQLT
ncbi:MAG: hypothetical protein ABIO88_04070, partial [Burkholderiaceae bacterium]